MTTQLKVNDLETLQSTLKALTTQLKKFSFDNKSIREHAAEIIEKQEKEKEKKNFDILRKKFKFTKSDIDEFIDDLFSSMTDLIDDENDSHWRYNVQDYLVDNHGEIVEKWKKKILVFREEMRDELINLSALRLKNSQK